MCCHYETGLSLWFKVLEKNIVSWVLFNKMTCSFNNNCMYINNTNINLMKNACKVDKRSVWGPLTKKNAALLEQEQSSLKRL